MAASPQVNHVADIGFLIDDDEGHPLSFHRVSSLDILYEAKEKKPKFIDKYLLGDILGEGSYSKVKEALDTETLERRAIKIMKLQRLRRIPNGEQNVHREIHLHRTLRHQNVVTLIDTFFSPEKEKWYMIMEYCPFVLQELLNSSPNKRLPFWQASDYFRQLLQGLEYLHGQGIIHNDIKPGNLLLDNSGVVKITDFGVSQQIDRFQPDDLIQPGQGSPAFQPPEVANGSPVVHAFKVDVWSSGVTLYNITTGKYPFEGDSVYKLFENIARGEFSIPEDITDELLIDLIECTLRKDPKERFSVAQVKRHIWLQKKHPYDCDSSSVPARNATNGINKSITVLPYLNQLHSMDPGDELEDEDASYDDSVGVEQEFEGVHFNPNPCSSSYRGDEVTANGNNNDLKVMNECNASVQDQRLGKERRGKSHRSFKSRTAGLFSCLGIRDNDKQS